MLEIVDVIGTPTKQWILSLARALTQDSAPGFVAAILIAILIVTSLWFLLKTWEKLEAISWLYKLIKQYKTPQAFTQNITEIDFEVNKRWRQIAFDDVVRGWFEYKETLVLYGEDSTRHYKNSVRPSTFFNSEDLNFGPGSWRILPGLFVTIGLFLTFLGLVAALDAIQVSGSDTLQLKESLQQLLTTASAKFVMSLSGLACSIVFTIILRLSISKIENRLHELCNHTEYLLKFISVEDIALDQLDAIKEQKEHFRSIGMELVAELGRPLREELPLTISQSIADAMSPLVEKVAQVGTEGVGGMVEDLSTKFSDDVGKALKSASASIEMAGDKIEKLATKMDDSSGNLNQELSSSIQAISKVLTEIKLSTVSNAEANSEAMNAGAENFLKIMSENLEAIRLNTAQGASAISDAAEKMNEAADTFKNQLAKATEDSSNTVRYQMNAAGENAGSAISEAGSKLLETFGTTSGTITEHANSLSETLLEPLKEFQDNLSKLGKEISASGTEFGRLGENIKLGAVSTEKAARSFENSATEFSKVVAPINLSIEKISQSINSLENSTDQANRSLTKGISALIASSEQAFEAAVEIIRGEQAALENSLQGMQDMIEAFKGQGDRLDDMDEKLGVAFEQYAEHVESQLDQMKQHARDLTEKLSPALDKMREVVEHAEQFIPESRVNRR